MNLKHLLCFFPILFVNGFIFVPDKIKLKFLRQNIDFIDDKIYNLLDLRYKIVKEVGQQKRVVYDRDRETSILNRLKAKEKLNEEFVEKLWRLIFSESYKIQMK